MRQAAARREPKESQPAGTGAAQEEKRRKEGETEARRSRAVDLVAETFEALLAERGDIGKIWASVLKEAIKRRKPDFKGNRYGFRGLSATRSKRPRPATAEVGRDEKSGTCGPVAQPCTCQRHPRGAGAAGVRRGCAARGVRVARLQRVGTCRPRRNGRGGRKGIP